MAKKKAISSTKKNKSAKAKTATIVAMPAAAKAKKADSKFIAFFKNNYAKYRKMPIIAALIAEFIATFILVASFLGLNIQSQPLFIGFIIIGLVIIFGSVSGAYMNPAMVVGGLITKKLSPLRSAFYILTEILASVAAWYTMQGFVNKAYAGTEYTSQILLKADTITSGNEWFIFFSELLGTFILALAVAAAIRFKKNSVKAALAYGFGSVAALLMVVRLTSMILSSQYLALSFLNPSVAIAAQALTWDFWPIMIFVIAPIIGGALGFLISEAIKSDDENCDCTCC